MAAAALSEGAFCRLQLEAVNAGLRCVVVGFNGPRVLLLAVEPAGALFRESVDLSKVCFLLPEGDGSAASRTWAQEGQVEVSPDYLQCLFRSDDGFFAGQRRAYSRAPVAMPVTLLAGGQRHEATTADLSVGGCRLAMDAPPSDEAVDLTLRVGDGAITTAARLVRRLDDAVMYEFVDLDEAGQHRLSSTVLSWHAQNLPAAALAQVARLRSARQSAR